MKDNKNIICSIIIAVAIIIAGMLISNALSEGFTTLREAISYVGEISH